MEAGFVKYFYFIGITVFVPIWVILFSKKERRKDMLFIGILMGIGAVVIEHLYAKLDYWSPVFIFPKFPFEDFYYGFIFGGISAEFYELIFKVRDSKRRRYPTHKSLIIISALITGFSFLVLVTLVGMNSIVAHVIPPLVIGLVVVTMRREFLVFSVFNGVAIAIITFFMFQILLFIYPDMLLNHWMLENLSGIYFFNLPVEELLFAFSVGFGAANIYEVIFGYSEVKVK